MSSFRRTGQITGLSFAAGLPGGGSAMCCDRFYVNCFTYSAGDGLLRRFTVADDSSATVITASLFSNVAGCAVSMDGEHVYVADSTYGLIKVSATSFTDVNPPITPIIDGMQVPAAVCTDNVHGDVYAFVSDADATGGSGNEILYKIAAGTDIATLFAGGSHQDTAVDGIGAANIGWVDTVSDCKVDPSGTTLYFTNYGGAAVRKITLASVTSGTLIGSYAATALVYDTADNTLIVGKNTAEFDRVTLAGVVTSTVSTAAWTDVPLQAALAGSFVYFNTGSASNQGKMYVGPHAGATLGDPHVHGFKGQRFDIDGEPGTIYNWYSDVDISVNARLGVNPEDGLHYVTEVAVQLGPEVQVRFRPLPDYMVFLHPWNGHNLTTNGTTDDEPACARVFWADRQSLVVQYHTYTLKMRTMTPIAGSGKYHHIDLSMSTAARNPLTVHGVLGQTHRLSGGRGAPAVARGRNGEGVIEGALADYFVGDMFSTKFKYNQFRGERGLLSPAQCRALLESPKSGDVAAGFSSTSAPASVADGS